jgi:hypothetical protein
MCRLDKPRRPFRVWVIWAIHQNSHIDCSGNKETFIEFMPLGEIWGRKALCPTGNLQHPI